MLEANRVAETQLHLSQLSYRDDDEDEQQDEEDEDASLASSLSEAEDEQHEAEGGPGSQHLPLPNSSDRDSDFQSDGEPRRSGRVKKSSGADESQQWQIDHGLIPAPGAKGKAKALNAKKKKNIEPSQLNDEFELLE